MRSEMGEWAFLLDENIDPKAAAYLEKADVSAEHMRDGPGLGTDDSDILPYARAHELIVVTSDVSDFGALPADAHAGLVLLHDDTLPAYRIASAVITMVDAYPDRDAFPGRETLDSWA